MELGSCPALSPCGNDVSLGQNSAEKGEGIDRGAKGERSLDKVDTN